MSQYPAVIHIRILDPSFGFQVTGVPSTNTEIDASSAGDVNGDGYDDFIVSSPFASVNGARSGAAYVIFGGPGHPSSIDVSSLDGTNGFRIVGSSPFEDVGSTVSAAGDINGDGFADVIIGAPGFSTPGHLDPGAAYVIYGKASGFPASLSTSSIDGTNGFKISGEVGRNATGYYVSSAGDFNGDGVSDVMLTAAGGPTLANSGVPGVSYVVFGSASGFGANLNLSSLNGVNGFRIASPSPTLLFSGYLHSAGDVNGDGFNDIAVGGVNGDFVIFGSAAGFPATLDPTTLNGSNGFKVANAFGVSPAGDINGDGFADLVYTDKVGFDVLFGKASGYTATYGVAPDGSNGFTILDNGKAPNLATYGSSAGDINGDGIDDLSIGGGRIIIFGKTSGFGPTFDISTLDGTNGFELQGIAPGNAFSPMSDVADVNGDGLPDVILASGYYDIHGGTGAGGATVVLGRAPNTAVSRTGTDISQHLVGGAFNDTLVGLGGDDHLYGNGGADSLDGGAGNDIIDGGAGTDTATYADATTGVTVSLATAGPQATGGAGTDTLIAIENLTGSPFADTLTGDGGGNTIVGAAGDDVLIGGAGNDSLDGGVGNDTLDGGAGADTLNGGGGSDTASYADAPTKVTVSLATSGPQDTIGAGLDTLVGIENLTGSPFNDTLTGDSLTNVLSGGAGNDTLDGGAGNDTLDGGPGPTPPPMPTPPPE